MLQLPLLANSGAAGTDQTGQPFLLGAPLRSCLTYLRSFFLYALIEALQSHDHTLVRAIAYDLDRIGGGNAKGQQALVDLDQFGFGAHAHAHWRRRKMTHVEVRAQALLSRRKQVFQDRKSTRP